MTSQLPDDESFLGWESQLELRISKGDMRAIREGLEIHESRMRPYLYQALLKIVDAKIEAGIVLSSHGGPAATDKKFREAFKKMEARNAAFDRALAEQTGHETAPVMKAVWARAIELCAQNNDNVEESTLRKTVAKYRKIFEKGYFSVGQSDYDEED